jgi:glycosyltransferase involved in cell wall biosynthesis
MKIVLVAIPNHHFFQWTSQLQHSGFEVFWFDPTDDRNVSNRIPGVQQHKKWKLRWDFPFRFTIKEQLPKLYKFIQKYNERNTASEFKKHLLTIKPDLVHCFEMQLTGLPILSVMQQNNLPFIYSSWGSDLYDFQNLGVSLDQAISFLKRVDYLITDCHRDFKIAQNLGFVNQFLGVFPGNGGIEIETDFIQTKHNRKAICIKGYDDGVGKAINILKAIESIQNKINKSTNFLIFSADEVVENYVRNSNYFKQMKTEIISRKSFHPNKYLLRKMGLCLIYIGNSTSDGMPNSLLEAMGMGAFPIQSNPGNATEEVITDNKNGFLIQNPDNIIEIANHVLNALENPVLLTQAFKYNTNLIQHNYNRSELQDKIVSLYITILQPK